jgi:hypothetical protein
VPLRCGDVHLVRFADFILVLPNSSNGKKGFGDPCINQHTFEFPKEILMCLFHYRRRREPPVPLSCGDCHLGFIYSGNAFAIVLLLPNICRDMATHHV